MGKNDPLIWIGVAGVAAVVVMWKEICLAVNPGATGCPDKWIMDYLQDFLKNPGGSLFERQRLETAQQELVQQGATGDRDEYGKPLPITPAGYARSYRVVGFNKRGGRVTV